MPYTSRTSGTSAHVSQTSVPAGPTTSAQTTAGAGSLGWGERCRLRSADANVHAPQHHQNQAASPSAAPSKAAGRLAASLHKALSPLVRQARRIAGRMPQRTMIAVGVSGTIVGTAVMALSGGLIPAMILAGVVIGGTVVAGLIAKSMQLREDARHEAGGRAE